MGSLFNYDNPLFSALNKFCDCAFLSLLWLIFSIPIFTLGASTTALYYTVNKVIRRNRSHVWREFWGAFKSNFKQSTIILLIFIVLSVVAGVDYYCVKTFASQWNIPQFTAYIFLAMLNILLIWAIFTFPYIARFECHTKQTLKNTLAIFMLNFLWAVLLWAILMMSIFVVFVLPLTIFLVPTISMLISNFILERIFRKYMSPEDLEREDALNQSCYD